MADGDLPQARAIWERTHRIAPSNLGLCLSLVDVYERLGQIRKAIEVLSGAKKFFPADLEIRGRLARCFIETKSFRQAKTELKDILSFTGSEVDNIPHFLMALVYARRVKDALRLVKKYVQIRGETAETLYYEVLIHTFRHDQLRFTIPWQKLLKTQPAILDERFEYLRLVLTPSDVTFLSNQIAASMAFFVAFPETQRQLSGFQDRLKAIPAIGESPEPKRLVIERDRS
jgi:tetratricopeptide (TPR) repeat protein